MIAPQRRAEIATAARAAALARDVAPENLALLQQYAAAAGHTAAGAFTRTAQPVEAGV